MIRGYHPQRPGVAKEYRRWLDSQPERQFLQKRIRAIKQACIEDVIIPKQEQIIERVFAGNKILKPRDARDVGRVISIIKALALLNCWYRQREGVVILADETDIAAGFDLWESIAESQSLGLPPYICRIYQEIILPAYTDKNAGLTRQDILQRHLQVYGRLLSPDQLRKEILPMMESAGLITQEADPNDKRKTLVYPTTRSPISSEQKPDFQDNNAESTKREIGDDTVG